MGEEESEFIEEKDEIKSISVICYHTEDFISKPKVSENGSIPLNILELDYSFGYDCKKRFNLCVADPNNLIFASGNLIHFFDVPKNKITFRRCSTGGGIGFITKHPAFNHIAIGENGDNPPIIIYDWPSMEIITVLHKGTTHSYSSLKYSPDGSLLVSQGGDPDYLITMWDWQKSTIALQCKSYGQDIFNIVFSNYLTGRMVTCGSGHIKSWKIAETFTGLKLQGELGRFGKTEISDIESVYPMPDEKIISGCEWGNILVWAEGLIKTEVRRRNNKSCHKSYVSQFEYENGRLISIGTDGCINIWYYETIDNAIPSDLGNILEVEPVDQFQVENEAIKNELSPPVMLMQILKQNPSDKDNYFWYAQDGNGGIWLLDLSYIPLEKTEKEPAKMLFTCHAGPILDMSSCDWGPYVITVGEDNRLCIYDYEKKTIMLNYLNSDKPSCVIWLPYFIELTGSTIIVGYNSGVIRIMNIKLLNNYKYDVDNLKLIQVLKPHTMKITRMSINSKNSILVTGSEDKTFFVFMIKIEEKSYPNLIPIGYLKVPSIVTFITWKPDHMTTIFVGCSDGDCIEVELPEEPQPYITVSYELTKCKPIIFKFQSVKSNILRAKFQEETEIQKQRIVAEKMEEIRQLRENNPGIEIDDEAFIEAALEAEAKLPDIYIPKEANAVLLALYTKNSSILLSMARYDAGFMYEYSSPEQNKKTTFIKAHLIESFNDEEIRSYLFYNNRKYIIFGMEHGEIRVCKINPNNETDFSDYWILPMHDNSNGHISAMCLSYNKKMLLTCGHDGNIFSFSINDESFVPEIEIPIPKPTIERLMVEVPDIEYIDHPSIEEVIIQTEKNRIMKNAKDDKTKTLEKIHHLIEEFNSILKKNNNLPLTQRLLNEELELDPRITKDFNMQLKKEMDLVYKKLEFNVEKSKFGLKKLMNHFIDPITCLPFAVKRILKPNTMIHSLREFKLTGDYVIDRSNTADQRICLTEKKEETDTHVFSAKSSRTVDNEDLDDQDNDEGVTKLEVVESFLRGLSPRTIEFHLGDEINNLLRKYRSLKKKLEEQEQEWKNLVSKKPNPKVVSPEDESTIQHAENTIGDYKLKASPNYVNSNVARPTVESKYQQIITCRRKIHFRREDFNNKLKDLRARKVELQKEVNDLIKKLKNIHTEIPAETVKPLPFVPEIDYDIEFPEKNLELEKYVPMEDRVKETKKKKQLIYMVLPVDDFDEEYESLLLDASYFRTGKPLNIYKDDDRTKVSIEIRMVRIAVPADVLAAVEAAEKVETKLEHDMKRARAARKIHEQYQILSYVRKSYETFDDQLDDLQKERFEIVHESTYMDLFLLTLHQELIILKRFENVENKIISQVKNTEKNKKVIIRKAKKLTRKIEDKTSRINKIQQKINENNMRYVNSIKGNKFYSFLKKICKKKYRPPRKDDASSSSSSSSSESSSSDENEPDESDDSQKVEMIHVDETICPEGCSKELYDEAFVMREKRYEKEFQIRDEQRLADIWQKELDGQRKKLKMIDTELKENHEKLKTLLIEKQTQLNDIDITVLMKLHQLQCFTDKEKSENIQNCLIIDKNQFSRLYKKVGELQHDTEEELDKYKNDKQHLQNIKKNFELMNNNLGILKEQIKKEMIQKFGQQISLVNLYETVLKRLIYNVKANTTSLVKFYDDKIKSAKTEYVQQLKILKDLINENTEKLSFLTVLEEELLKLYKTLNYKLMSEEEINQLESQYTSELNKLKKILKNQEKQKKLIIRDIQFLTNKSRNITPLDNLNTDIECRRSIFTVIDGTEHCSSKYELQENELLDDDSSLSKVLKETTITDSSQHKKNIAIRHMLAHVTTEERIYTEETIDEMLIELTENLKKTGMYLEKIDANVTETIEKSEVQEFSEEDKDLYEGQELYEEPEPFELEELFNHNKVSQESSKHTIEYFDNIEYRYYIETSESLIRQKIGPAVSSRLIDFFFKIGIQNNVEEIAHDLMYKLRRTEDVNFLSQFILQKLSTDIDSEEKKVSISKDVKQMILDIKGLLEIEETEVVQHEDEF